MPDNDATLSVSASLTPVGLCAITTGDTAFDISQGVGDILPASPDTLHAFLPAAFRRASEEIP
ncbi:MAG TPA: hypothetical protein GX702_13475 [Chloroflexi bacterium]|jgi:hypothetical protein|nr:hypothetical protein [Chloroflexota bacterium]